MSITCCDKSCLLDRRPIYAGVGCWNLKPCMDCSGLTPSFPIVKFLLLAKATMYSEYSKIVDQVDFSDVTLVGEDGREKSPPQLQILTLSQN